MSKYTPLTGQVRAAYANYYRHKSAHAESVDALDAEFSRWLAAHDAEVAATTLRDVATALASSFHPSLSDEDTISTLHVYADEYEKEAGL